MEKEEAKNSKLHTDNYSLFSKISIELETIWREKRHEIFHKLKLNTMNNTCSTWAGMDLDSPCSLNFLAQKCSLFLRQMLLHYKLPDNQGNMFEFSVQ